MDCDYTALLICLSIVAAFLASFTTLESVTMLRTFNSNRLRFAWQLGNACAIGLGIWAMHFAGLVASVLAIASRYNFVATAVSLACAIGTSQLALLTVDRKRLSLKRLTIFGCLAGSGINAMHYTGLHAIQTAPFIVHSLGQIGLPLAMSILTSTVSMALAFRLRNSAPHMIALKRLGAVSVIACAVVSLHYTGMNAATFAKNGLYLSSQISDSDWLTFVVVGASTVVLVGALCLFSTQASRISMSLLQAAMSIRRLGRHDALTDLPNRAYLMLKARDVLDHRTKRSGLVAVLFIDLDGFKGINDSLGHAFGDELLKQVAARLRACVHHDDLIARLGGDEFVIVVEDLPDAASADAIAQKILTGLSEEFLLKVMPIRIGASIGITIAPKQNASIESLLLEADSAMYVAKRSGSNTFQRFDESMRQSAFRALQLQRDLHFALKNNELKLVFQPNFTVGGDLMTGAEVLLRWQHPVLGSISPLEFIPMAERAGLIVQIGNWILRTVCAHIASWDKNGLVPITVSMNLSWVQFNIPGLVDRINAVVKAENVQPGRLMFEISETTAMRDVVLTRRNVGALREQGYSVALDDFGTGYSSLRHLREFQVDQIKVDRSFLSNLGDNASTDADLFTAVVALTRALGIEVLAEGVETLAQSQRLVALNCDLMQGSFCGAPLSAEEFQKTLTNLPQSHRTAYAN